MIESFEKNKNSFLVPTSGKELWESAKLLLIGMLECEPNSRFTVFQCLDHEIFKQFKQSESEENNFQ